MNFTSSSFEVWKVCECGMCQYLNHVNGHFRDARREIYCVEYFSSGSRSLYCSRLRSAEDDDFQSTFSSNHTTPSVHLYETNRILSFPLPAQCTPFYHLFCVYSSRSRLRLIFLKQKKRKKEWFEWLVMSVNC